MNTPFIIEVTHEVTDTENLWIAECDQLGLVTEADSYEQLTKNCWQLLPDLLELNKIGTTVDKAQLRFEHLEYAEIG